MTTRMNFKPRKDQRRKDAEARQEAYNLLSPHDKILTAGAKEKIKLDKKPKGE
jgi:hypothetical protein